MEDQVLSIKQMQHLKEFCVDTSKASVYWARMCHGSGIRDESKSRWFLSLQKDFQVCGFMAYEVIPTFTLGDMLEMMPPALYSNRVAGGDIRLRMVDYACKGYFSLCKSGTSYTAAYGSDHADTIIMVYKCGRTALEAAYNMLCWLAESKLLGKEEDK